jgi:hypothetical protein
VSAVRRRPLIRDLSPLDEFAPSSTAISVSGLPRSLANARFCDVVHAHPPERWASASGTRWSMSRSDGAVKAEPVYGSFHVPAITVQSPGLKVSGPSASAIRTS